MRNAFIALLLLAFFVGYSEAGKQNSVEGLRYASYKSHTRVVVDVDGPVDFSQHRLSNPERIYFDLKACTISGKAQSSVSIQDDILKTVRLAQFEKGTVRVVIDVNETKNFYAFLLENPYRLVIDVYGSGSNRPVKKEVEEIRKTTVERGTYEIRRIMIDPGHGGKDPGAIGPRGVKEKDITLDVGKKLGAILQEKYDVEILYTRDKDVFVPLNERTEMANAKKADLFISIHTNASKRQNARGLETYFLNWTNDKEATKVAARENKISVKKMMQMQNELQFILQDLARNSKKEESMRLAHSVQNSMARSLKKDYREVNDLGVKSALFYVLVGAEMPSILVETSFISNREEEMRLSSKKYKNTLAEAIAKGINSYITQSMMIVRPAAETKDAIVSVDSEGLTGKRSARLVRNQDVFYDTIRPGDRI